MKKKSEKKKDLDALREKLADSGTVFLTGYEKMTVAQDFELRKTVRGAGGNYKVIKNRIAEKAGLRQGVSGVLVQGRVGRRPRD